MRHIITICLLKLHPKLFIHTTTFCIMFFLQIFCIFFFLLYCFLLYFVIFLSYYSVFFYILYFLFLIIVFSFIFCVFSLLVSVHEGQWGTRALFMRDSGGPGLCSWGTVGDPGSVHEGQWGTRALLMRVRGTQALFMRDSGGPGLCSWGTVSKSVSKTLKSRNPLLPGDRWTAVVVRSHILSGRCPSSRNIEVMQETRQIRDAVFTLD